MFVDIVKITVKAGNGGDGAISFHREKYIASGGPDGGNGGNGGNIIFVADKNLSTLADFKYKKKYCAKNGENGKSERRFGKKGEDLIIKVPYGTLLKDAETGRIIADISSSKPQIIAKGGRGGFGNSHFATSTRQSPRFAKPGIPGEELYLQLELKLLADVGLIGYPNVGKSTLISVVSEAKPIIADYHFTTITPVLGVVRMPDSTPFVVADIPGLIDGAGEGVGLGHQFLRHIERCRLLVHIVDVSGIEGRDPIKDFETINQELEKFNPELSKRPMIVAGNKCDLATDKQVQKFEEYIEKKGYEFFPIMAAIRYDVDPLLQRVQELLSKLPPIAHFEPEPIPLEKLSGKDADDVKITNKDGIFFVESEKLLRIMRLLDFEDFEALNYFQKVLDGTGVTKALKDSGIKQGDTVSIYNMEFDFMD